MAKALGLSKMTGLLLELSLSQARLCYEVKLVGLTYTSLGISLLLKVSSAV